MSTMSFKCSAVTAYISAAALIIAGCSVLGAVRFDLVSGCRCTSRRYRGEMGRLTMGSKASARSVRRREAQTAAIELAGNGGLWLSITAGVYMLARVAHGIGMDGEGPTLLRKIGVIVTFGTQLFLAGYAVGITLAVI